MLFVPFMTTTQFAKLTKMGDRQVRDRMNIGDIPEVLHERKNATRYVDLVELIRRMGQGQFELSNLSGSEFGGDKSV